MADKKAIVIQTFGPFAMRTEAGRDITPRGRKACGLIAMLCLSPNFRRTRRWLQDHLWSDRGESQAAGSMRQTLVEIRKAMDTFSDLLATERGLVYLKEDGVRIAGEQTGQELLEGMDIRDEEFEDWLREARAVHREHRLLERTYPEEPRQQPRQPLRLVIETAAGAPEIGEQALVSGISGLIGRSMRDGLDIEILSGDGSGSAGAADLMLCASMADGGRIAHIALEEGATKRQLWSELIAMGNEVEHGRIPEVLLRGINVSSNVAMGWLLNSRQNESGELFYYRRALEHLSRYNFHDFLEADRLFAAAYEAGGRSIHLAWRAYLRSFLAAEMMPTDLLVLEEEARGFMRQAMTAEPYNSLVLSLCAQCEAMVFLDFINAYELARRSVKINPSNAFAWACLGVAESHLGRPGYGMQHCRKARAIAGTSIFAPHIDILACIVAVMAGEFPEARHFGEAAHGRAPSLVAPLRFLAALCFHDRDDDRGSIIVDRLKTLEPGFMIGHLRDPSYPAESLRKSTLMASLPAGG